MTFDPSPRFHAAIEFLQRTGMKQFQLRWSDDEKPNLFMAVAGYKLEEGMKWEVDASLDPERAILRLCERLADGGTCAHCTRPTGFDPDTMDSMPLNDLVCWYQFDPGAKKFIRGCA